MCLKTPSSPPIREQPNRDTGAAASSEQRRRISSQQSTYGNIFSSVLGDSSYNTNTNSQKAVAALGA